VRPALMGTRLTAAERHLPYQITQCYLPLGTGGTEFAYPRVDLGGWLIYTEMVYLLPVRPCVGPGV